MTPSRRYLIMLAIVVLTSLPATAAYLYYHYTKDPYFQPLGLTRETLAELDGHTEFVSIVVRVDWGRERIGGVTRKELRELITKAFATRTDRLVYRFNDVPGKDIAITFVVGPNGFGPYSPSWIVDGMILSTVALDMMEAFRNDMQASSDAN